MYALPFPLLKEKLKFNVDHTFNNGFKTIADKIQQKEGITFKSLQLVPDEILGDAVVKTLANEKGVIYERNNLLCTLKMGFCITLLFLS